MGGREVLRGVNLEVKQGEFLAIIGASGGGKSTLLRVIAGLLPTSSGTVSVASSPALVFQDYRLLPWRTVVQNVELPAQVSGAGRYSPQQALELVGMGLYAQAFPRQLSGGMRARVALARALAQRGDIVLLDEPFAALDALVRERFNAELRHLHEKTGQTTILVTHSIREAVRLADRVAVLRGGEIVEVLDTRQAERTPQPEGLEAHLRDLLGVADSTEVKRPAPPLWSWSLLLPVLTLLALLAAWQWAAVRLQQPFLLPTPEQVWARGRDNAPLLWSALWVTARTTLLGTALGGLLGLLIGYPVARWRLLERALSPLIVMSQSTPIVILAPLLVSWVGFGFLPAVLVSALSAFYPVLVATLVGVREVDRTYHELFQSLGANFWQRLVYLEWPAALPMLLGGLRLSSSLALIGAVVWEFTDPNQKGIGVAVQQAKNNYDMALQLAAVALLIAFGVTLYSLVTWLERRVMLRQGR